MPDIKGLEEIAAVGLDSQVARGVVSDVAHVVSSSFDGGSIAFAFIAGSIAKNRPTEASDIDIVVCLEEEPPAEQIQVFRQGYFDLHASYNATPDLEYPGEIFCVSTLRHALERVRSEIPVCRITNSTVFDGIVWAGMIAAPKLVIAGSEERVGDFVIPAASIVDGWHGDLHPECGQPETMKDLCLKKVISYEPE